MPLTSRAPSRGFTLIELMITVLLAVILMMVALPVFTKWIQNTKTRSIAESLQNGIRLAKTEALRRSRLVDFRLTAATPGKGAATSKSGTNWYVQQNSALLAADSTDANYNLYVQGSSQSDANSNVTVAGDVDVLTFSSLGRLTNTGAASYKFVVSNPNGDRTLNVIVTQGGQIRMCDPQITLSSTNPTGC